MRPRDSVKYEEENRRYLHKSDSLAHLGAKATSSLAVLFRHSDGRASAGVAALATSTAFAGTISVTQTLSSDELRRIAQSDILRPCSSIIDATSSATSRNLSNVLFVTRRSFSSSSTKPATLLALSISNIGSGADCFAGGEPCATAAGAVGVGEAATGDELEALAITDVVVAAGIRG